MVGRECVAMRRRGWAVAGLGAVATLLASCGPRADIAARFVAIPEAAAPVIAEYESRLRALVAGAERERLRRAAGLAPGETARAEFSSPALRARYEAAESATTALESPVIPPLEPAAGLSAPQSLQYDRPWRRAEATLYLDGRAGTVSAPFRFSGVQAEAVTLRLQSVAPRRLRVRLSCDGGFRLNQRDAPERRADAGETLTFELATGSRGEAHIELPVLTQRCTVESAAPGAGWRVVEIEREERAAPELARLDTRFDICAIPPMASLDRLERAFFADRWMSQSCVLGQTAATRLLPEGRAALNAKIEALTGRPVSEAALEAGDPEMALDFSAAPRLDLIYVSYLHIRADFTGYLMARMLRYHAARGTSVRILTSDNLMLDDEKRLFAGLAATYPNIQMQNFAWTPPGIGAIAEQIDRIHRAHHVKLFATLSPEPGRSRAHLGGRNLHDGFTFDTPRDLSDYAYLRDYDLDGGPSLAFFSAYVDFEVELRSDAAVRAIAAHLSTLWHRDMPSSVIRPFSMAREQVGAPRRGMRHFLSMPYADGRAQEAWLVELFDAAERSIRIATPYLNPTPRLRAALERAAARGVEVTIVARREVTDPAGTIITRLNELFIERHAGQFALYEYAPDPRMLHSKLFLIDGRLSVISSINLNQRSFIHDSENGLVVLDPVFHDRIAEVFDGYLATSRRLRPGDAEIPDLFRILFTLRPLLERF